MLRFGIKALTQEQINLNMVNEIEGSEANLLGFWNFNDGEGSTLTDQSGNGNDGTIYGATWSTDVPPILFNHKPKQNYKPLLIYG